MVRGPRTIICSSGIATVTKFWFSSTTTPSEQSLLTIHFKIQQFPITRPKALHASHSIQTRIQYGKHFRKRLSVVFWRSLLQKGHCLLQIHKIRIASQRRSYGAVRADAEAGGAGRVTVSSTELPNTLTMRCTSAGSRQTPRAVLWQADSLRTQKKRHIALFGPDGQGAVGQNHHFADQPHGQRALFLGFDNHFGLCALAFEGKLRVVAFDDHGAPFKASLPKQFGNAQSEAKLVFIILNSGA